MRRFHQVIYKYNDMLKNNYDAELAKEYFNWLTDIKELKSMFLI